MRNQLAPLCTLLAVSLIFSYCCLQSLGACPRISSSELTRIQGAIPDCYFFAYSETCNVTHACAISWPNCDSSCDNGTNYACSSDPIGVWQMGIYAPLTGDQLYFTETGGCGFACVSPTCRTRGTGTTCTCDCPMTDPNHPCDRPYLLEGCH